MNWLKKIIYNCHRATYLIEKKQIKPLNFRETAALKIHLIGCKVCRVFQKQSIVIKNIMTEFLANNDTEKLLDDDFKESMQTRIETALNKNSLR